MKIKYSSSLWIERKGLSGSPQKVNWRFEHRGNKCVIPFIYRFSNGIVFDVINLLDEKALHDFIDKYEEVESSLTPLQRKCAEQEHPYRDLSIKDIWIDGKRVDGSRSSSSIVDIPWADRNSNETAVLRKEYESVIDDSESYGIQRFCIPYPNVDSKVKRIMHFFRLNRIGNIKFDTMPVKEFSPLNIRFKLSDKEREKEVEFKHPITGTIHKLFFKNPEPAEVPLGIRKEHSIFVVNANYEIEPPLPVGDNLKFENSLKNPELKNGEFGPESASAMGIIGGASGPTAIGFSTNSNEEMRKYGVKGLPLHNCFSIPSFRKEETWKFNIEGIQLHISDGREYLFGG
jgi:hypothetical protein